jgi:hypothetical protein
LMRKFKVKRALHLKSALYFGNFLVI